MRDDPDHAAPNLQRFDRAGGGVERGRIKCAESLIDEQAIKRNRGGGALDLLAQFKSERERGEKCLAPGERVGASLFPRVVVVGFDGPGARRENDVGAGYPLAGDGRAHV